MDWKSARLLDPFSAIATYLKLFSEEINSARACAAKVISKRGAKDLFKILERSLNVFSVLTTLSFIWLFKLEEGPNGSIK